MSGLTQLAASPPAFRGELTIDTDRGPRRLSRTMDPWQRADFEALDAAWQRLAGYSKQTDATRRAYLERPRGHSKTSDLAVMVAYVLFAAKRQVSGVAAAGDKDQARLLRDAIARIVSLNPVLGNHLDVQRDRVANLHTGSTLEIISSDAATSYGITPHFIIVDELTHWGKPDLWDSLISSAAKRRDCVMVVISNAGHTDSWQWQTREAVRHDPAWYFSRLDGPQASWITADQLAEQRRLLRAEMSYRRLWLNEWIEGAGDALDRDDLAAAFTLSAPLATAERGWTYVAGLDLGLSRDATALAIVGRHDGYQETIEVEREQPVPLVAAVARRGNLLFGDDEPPPPLPPETETVYHNGSGRLRLAALHVWRSGGGGRVSLEDVRATILAEWRRFRIATVGFDPWQAKHLEELLLGSGVRCECVDFTPSNLRSMAAETLDAFNQRRIDLYPHDQLMADLRTLRVEEKGYGVRLTSPRGPGGHGDCATALSIALHSLRRIGTMRQHIEGELLCWP